MDDSQNNFGILFSFDDGSSSGADLLGLLSETDLNHELEIIEIVDEEGDEYDLLF